MYSDILPLQVDIVNDKVETEKIMNSLMDEDFPSLILTDQYTFDRTGKLYDQIMDISRKLD